MIIFLYGRDTYRSCQKLKEIIEKFKKAHKNGLRLRRFDVTQASFQEFEDETRANSIFKEKKMIVLDNVFSSPDFKKKILRFLKKKKEAEDVIIFYEDKEISKKDALFKLLKEKGKSQEFSLLGGQKLIDWIRKEFNKYKARISPRVPEDLIEFIGDDLWQLSEEIKKIATFRLKGKEIITPDDIKLLVKPQIETNIFNTIDAISAGDKKRALNLLHLHLEKGDSPIYLFSMIKLQISNLLVVKDLAARQMSFSQIISRSKLHPFVVKKNYSLSQKFSLDQLKKLYRRIFKLEIKIKTGKIDPALALDILVVEI